MSEDRLVTFPPRSDAWLEKARGRYWEAAASGNGVRYVADGDLLICHDPSIMGDKYAVQFNMRDVFYIGDMKL